MEPFSIQQLINDAVKEDREPKEQKTWYASSLGQCLTRAYLERAGIAKSEFDERTQRVFHAGKMFEDWVITLLKKQYALDFRTQVPVAWEEKNLSGKADLLIQDIVYEIKSKHSRAFWYMVNKGEGPNRHHMMQLWCYLHGLNKPEGRLVYISKDDLAVQEYPVFLNDAALQADVEAELDLLNKAWAAKLPPSPLTDKKDWRVKYCAIHEEYCLKQPQYYEVQ